MPPIPQVRRPPEPPDGPKPRGPARVPGAVWVLVGVAAFPLYVEFGGRFTGWLRDDGVPALLAAGGYWLSNAVLGALTIAGGALALWQASHQDRAGIVFGPLAALIVLLEGWMNSRHLRAMDTRQNSGE